MLLCRPLDSHASFKERVSNGKNTLHIILKMTQSASGTGIFSSLKPYGSMYPIIGYLGFW